MQLRIDTPRWAVPLLKPSRYKAIYGGRASGKSHERAESLIELCIMKPTRAVCIREIQRSINQSVKLLLEDKIRKLEVDHLFTIKQDRIEGDNGSLIIFQGMQNHTADSIKSLEGYDVAWVEEAQTLSQYSLDLLRPTIRKPGSEIWFTWNPRNETDPVDQFFRGAEPPSNSVVLNVNYMDNPWLPDVMQEEMEYDKSRDVEKYNHVWLGQYYELSDSLVFKNWRIEEFDAPEGTNFRYGADWGFANDPTVLIRCWAEGRNLYIDHEAYMVGCDIMDTPQLFMSIPQAERFPIVADSSRPETISHMKKNGFPKIIPAVKGKNSVHEGITWLQNYDIIVHPRCKHTIDELSHYRYKVDKLTDEILPDFEDKNNHVIDAVRYANEAHRRATVRKPIAFKPRQRTAFI